MRMGIAFTLALVLLPVGDVAAQAPPPASQQPRLSAVPNATAQEPAASGASLSPSGRFLALDVFGGFFRTAEGKIVPTPAYGQPTEKLSPVGWEIGATAKYHLRWLGLSTRVGHEIFEGLPVSYVAVGVSVQTGFWSRRSGKNVGRFFAHSLGGWAQANRTRQPDGSLAIVGIGYDFWVVRLEVDGVAAPFEGLRKGGYGRLLFGGSLPLCLRACRKGDMFNVSGQPPINDK